MGNHQSIVEINSSCPWVPEPLVLDQVTKIDEFRVNSQAETELFDSLSERIKKIDGVKCCVIDNPKRKFFSSRKITVNVIPEKKQFSIKGGAVATPHSGFKMSLQYLDSPRTFEAGAVFLSFNETKLFMNIKFPLIKFVDLERKNPVAHVSFGGSVAKYNIFDESQKAYSFNAKFLPSDESYSVSLFAYLREKAKDIGFLPYNDYVSFGISGKYLLSKDSSLVNDDTEADLKMKIKQRGSCFCVFAENDDLIPALKYSVHAVAKAPPNVIMRAEAGTLLSTKELPLAEKFVLGGGSTLRAVQPHKFTYAFNNVKVGCEHYITGGCDLRIPLIPEKKVDLMIYGSTGVGIKLHRSLIADDLKDRAPALFHVSSIGCGITASTDKVNIEATLSLPLFVSYGIETVNYQINITKNDMN